jgi:hypothetical protein
MFPPNEVVMVYICPEVEPDFVFDVKKDEWIGNVGTEYDLVVETISYLAINVKASRKFWEEVNIALKKDVGQYIGWHDFGHSILDKGYKGNHAVVQLSQSQLEEMFQSHSTFGKLGCEKMRKYVIGDSMNHPNYHG